MIPILNVSGVGPRLATILSEKGITTADQLAATLPAALLEIPGIAAQRAESLLAAANLALEGNPPKSSKARKAPAAPKAPRLAQVKVKPATLADEVETAAPPENADGKKTAAKKAKKKKAKTKKKAAAKKVTTKRKLKEKAAAKKAATKEAEKKAARKKAKASKRKKNGKPKKK